MANKHLVVDGAICMCTFGVSPDFLKVLTNKKEYANDAQGARKLIASTMDLGSPFLLGTFGACSKLLGSPCKSAVINWQGFYRKTQLYNGGYVLLEDSKATCPVGAPGCIRIIFHGQVATPGKPHLLKSKRIVTKCLNPGVDMDDVLDDTPELTLTS